METPIEQTFDENPDYVPLSIKVIVIWLYLLALINLFDLMLYIPSPQAEQKYPSRLVTVIGSYPGLRYVSDMPFLYFMDPFDPHEGQSTHFFSFMSFLLE